MDELSPMSEPQLNGLLGWMRERESIRMRRLQGCSPPWTEDPILVNYRFCNVRRRDDRVSQWIIRHICEPYAGHPHLWIMLAIARFINWPDTLQELMAQGGWPEGRTPNWATMERVLTTRVRRGEKVWTGAYMVRAERDGGGKIAYVVGRVLKETWQRRRQIVGIWEKQSCQMAHTALREGYGWGDFMAGQVVADWTYCPALLGGATDLFTWAPRGPGSQRGLNRLLGLPLARQWRDEEEWCEQLRWIRASGQQDLGVEFTDLTLHDWQNCLCEFDKYERARLGQGRPRSTYRPEARL